MRVLSHLHLASRSPLPCAVPTASARCATSAFDIESGDRHVAGTRRDRAVWTSAALCGCATGGAGSLKSAWSTGVGAGSALWEGGYTRLYEVVGRAPLSSPHLRLCIVASIVVRSVVTCETQRRREDHHGVHCAVRSAVWSVGRRRRRCARCRYQGRGTTTLSGGKFYKSSVFSGIHGYTYR